MDSPETSKPAATSPPVKDSPFSTFVSNLSPIPQVNAKSGLPSCRDLNLPSPEPVFASPHIIGQRKLAILKRSHTLSLTSIHELSSMHANEATTSSEDIYDNGPIVLGSKCQPVPRPQNKFNGDHCREDLPCSSPSSCADLILSVPLETSLNSTDLPDPYTKQATGMSHNICGRCTMTSRENGLARLGKDCNCMEEADDMIRSTKLDKCTTEIANDCVDEFGTVHAAKETDEISCTDQPSSILNDESINAGSDIAPSPGNQHEHDEIIIDTSFVPNNRENLAYQKLKPSTSDFCTVAKEDNLQATRTPVHSTPQILPGSLQDVQAVDEKPDIFTGKCLGAFHNQMAYDEEAFQHQRFMRKRLRFESDKTSSGCKKQIRNVDLDASHMESGVISSTKQPVQSDSRRILCKSAVSTDLIGTKEKSNTVADPRPSGIGLHLNSIGSIGQITATKDSNLTGKNLFSREKKLLSESSDQHSQGSVNLFPAASVNGQGVFTSTASRVYPLLSSASESDNSGHMEGVLPTSTDGHLYPLDVKPLRSIIQSMHRDHHMTPCSMRMLPSEDTRSLASIESSPRKKRKKANEGQKGCSCRRSKCLKLYCDCFAAGAVCTEVCGCRECFNKPEYGDMIHQTRQQIEARNPRAFAPRVVLRVTDSPEDNEESTHTTPSSGRHIRGCNCKKSFCLKKYCECYQAGVGCSIGCRCEGCKNTFGRKVDMYHEGCRHIEVEHKKSALQNLEMDQFCERHGLEMEAINNDHHCSHLSPLTPSVQYSSGPNMHKVLLPASYYTSPESSASILKCYEASPCSPIDSISSRTIENARKETNLLVPHDQELGQYDTMEVTTFSAGWNGYTDVSNLSHLPNLSPSDCSASATSKAREPKILQGKLFQEHAHLTVGSLRWRCSPVTPVPRFGESKIILEPDSSSGPHINVEHHNSDVLEETRLPIKAVKASSPKQKRVSLPQRHLRGTGRKFILKSVPSLPPLSPQNNDEK